jgi:glycosyltransferase involved in cell wall biosynthesis
VPHLQREVSPVADIRALYEIRALLRRVQPDLIHAHTSKAGLLGRLAGHLLGIPSVYTLHNWLFGTSVLPRVWGVVGPKCERLAAGWCARVITVSQEGASILRSNGIAPAAKIVMIYHGIRDCADRATLSADPPRVITMVARFSAQKDHEVLLRAFAALPPGPILRMVGDGPLRRDAEHLAHELGIYDRVKFLGDRDDVPPLLASSDLFVLASKYEMLPSTVLEAMRAGLPIVASDVGGVREIVLHGETGLLVPPQSASLLAEAMAQLIDNHDLRIRLGRAARARFSEIFQYSRQIELTRSLYLEVMSEKVKLDSSDFTWANAA